MAEIQPLKIVIVGHVDHGKSTLVGRLIHDTGSLPEGKFEAIQAMCVKRGMPFEWAFLMDALKAERDQGVTIDSAQIWFSTAQRPYVLIDAPGHKEFLKNMVSGAASADAALLVIDAAEGVREQSRRHGYLLHLLGVSQVAVAINKMDAVGYDQARFEEVAAEIRAYLAEIGVTPTHVIPVSAREGGNIAAAGQEMPWYHGATIVDALDGFEAPALPTELPLRLPVQDVYKFDARRIIAGRIETGRLKVGDTLLFSPSNKTAKVTGIEGWNAAAPAVTAAAGQSVGITLDDQIFVERGEIASHADHPPIETNVFRARVIWLGRKPLKAGNRYMLKMATARHPVEIQEIERVVDTTDLSTGESDAVTKGAVAEVVLRSRAMLALDEFRASPRTGRFVLVEDYDCVGGGIVSMEGYPDQRHSLTVKSTNIFNVDHRVTTPARWQANGHKSGVIWLTGLSGAGKTTLALELERRLFLKGYQVYVLDGDNVRHGLSADLAFSPDDRTENIRRVGEAAALFAEAGFIVITAFISPYRSDRDRARAIRPEMFHEIYVQADLETCEKRDPKGLYKKARAGEIEVFTGITAPYEAPDKPELTLDTAGHDVPESVGLLLDYVERNFGGTALVAVDSNGAASRVSARS